MRIVNTRNLKDGMPLGKPVFTASGTILLNKGVKLTNSYIKNLRAKSIPAVYVDDEISIGIDPHDAIDMDVKIRAMDTIKHIFHEMTFQDKGGKSNGFIPTKSYYIMKDIIADILNNLQKNKDSLFNMVEVMSTDLSTYIHCVNVAVLAVLTGRGLGLSRPELIDLGTGALMHDIGKSEIPIEIINKSGDLSDEEIEMIKQHTIFGYQAIKENASVSTFVKTIVLMHHERLDGSGYPLGVMGDKINQYTRIVSICDEFDTAISDKVNRKKMPIYKVLELIDSQVGRKLDEKIYKVFIKNISIFPPGLGVMLSNGESGLVVENNKLNPTRPKVRIIRGRDGKFSPGLRITDLMKDLTLFIQDTCDVSV